jgi:hypothetical protein
MNWWSLGEHKGHHGNILDVNNVTCAFCRVSGHFKHNYHKEKKSDSKDKTLNYEVLQCTNCGNYTMLFWSGSEVGNLHDFIVVPYVTEITKFPEYWPKDIGRYWVQAQRSLDGKNWDATAVMARSALQLAVRYHGAVGKNLAQEIDDLATKGLLPPVMKDWSHEVRALGNDIAHSTPGSSEGTEPQDAKDVVEFLSILLTMLYDLPHKIEQYRARKEP